jgi:hypothetical protein
MKATNRNRLLVERALVMVGTEPALRPRPGQGRKRAVRSVTVNLAEAPLGLLRTRGLVSARQFEAGETLRGDWEQAELAPSVTMRWDAPPQGKAARGAPEALPPTLARVAARRRFQAAVEAVGPGLTDILWRVVCAGEGMRDVERALGWPVRAGRIVLMIALDRLADHYRLK